MAYPSMSEPRNARSVLLGVLILTFVFGLGVVSGIVATELHASYANSRDVDSGFCTSAKGIFNAPTEAPKAALDPARKELVKFIENTPATWEKAFPTALESPWVYQNGLNQKELSIQVNRENRLTYVTLKNLTGKDLKIQECQRNRDGNAQYYERGLAKGNTVIFLFEEPNEALVVYNGDKPVLYFYTH